MLIRSTSTPVVGVLPSSFSDTPKRDHYDTTNTNHSRYFHPTVHDQTANKLSFPYGLHIHPNLSSFSWNSSPISHYLSGFVSKFNQQTKVKGLRRARSYGNVDDLAIHSCSFKEFCDTSTTSMSMLQTAPSLDVYNSTENGEENIGNMARQSPVVKSDGSLQRSVTIEERIDCDFSFGKNGIGLIEEKDEEGEKEEEALRGIQDKGVEEEVGEPVSPQLYLAAGLGIDGAVSDSNGVVEFNQATVDESGDAEEYYNKMVFEYPSHPLFLRNYAQLLQSKGDLHGAEDYYYRASLADPDDGEIWLQYAKLVWELYHDQEKSLIYFERAIGVASDDSHILAAHARFLWETDNDEEENRVKKSQIQIEEDKGLHDIDKSAYGKDYRPEVAGSGGVIDSLHFTGRNSGEDGDVEEYYKNLVEENPSTPLFLRNYAHFLHQSKGDLQGAEEFYSRAILADPEDGETMSEYAQLVWELHHDRVKASSYFERAVQATPADCHILAAYAKFLWEMGEDEEEIGEAMPIFQGDVMASANA